MEEEAAQTRPHKIRRVEEEATNEDFLSTLPLLVLSEVLDFLRGGFFHSACYNHKPLSQFLQNCRGEKQNISLVSDNNTTLGCHA